MKHKEIASGEEVKSNLIITFLRRSLFTALAGVALILPSGCHDDSVTPGSGDEGTDKYIGPTSEMTLGPETAGFQSPSFTLAIEAPDGSVIKREGSHLRTGQQSHLNLTSGLADGIYRLLYFEYPIGENSQLADLADTFTTTQFGLGSRVEVKDGMVTVLDAFDEEIGLPGKGTADEPYEISSYNSLIKLAQIVNSEEKNALITEETHFRQTGRIDMYQASRETDRRYGWLPIGANSALPFRGHYHGAELSTIIIERPNSAAVGLFGYVNNAAFYDVKITNSSVTGNFAAGALVGASLMSGNDRGLLSVLGCEVSGSDIKGSDQSVSVGALLGAADMHTRVFFQNCNSTDNKVQATYNAGGIVGGGGLYSSIVLNSCRNSSSVTSDYSGAGGLVGSSDTIQAASSSNIGKIIGGSHYDTSDKKNSGIGAGGLIGGVGTATLLSCSNSGEVSGHTGVGGLVGSSRVKGGDKEAYMFNNIMLRYCYNEGEVKGTDCVGGLTGEGQTGTYAVFNKGNVSGSRYVGGIAGNTSIAVTHNAINLGTVSGKDYVAGIVGKTTFGSLALDHNYGSVTATGSNLGGICGLAGNNTIIHYCGNFGNLDYSGNGYVGGIVGEIGDPREWTAMNITECVIGGAEIVMSILGPVMAASGHAIEAMSETLEIVLHITETAADAGLLYTDLALWTSGLVEMIEEEEIEELAASLSQEIDEINYEIKAEMAAMRKNTSFNLHDFNRLMLEGSYPSNVDEVLSFYESDGGDKRFNENINIAREEREEHLEKIHKTNEIIHQVVSGVCIVVGTAAMIGGAIATGGAAVPFILAGTAASLAGGLNAISKSCLEFEENVVIVSQCVNAGNISSKNKDAKVGGLVGRLHDNSILRDCLNTGDGPGRGFPFAGSIGFSVSQQRLLSLAKFNSWSDYTTAGYEKGRVIWDPDATSKSVSDHWSFSCIKILTNKSEVTDPATYTDVDKGWKMTGDDAIWAVPSETDAFPIPGTSEMGR
ncbi:MAG: hypothetical protein K2J48_08205 [Muribaculaceae bacterium]|nr:hypothetical protein [Muribaculaceae bacterium]